ncbi:MAG: hypothetical protein FJ279_26585 [Planctomycetes bacterium]|nr:hypothetical protein [Planctomycetota bacterium]
MAAGNRSVLVVLDSRRVGERARADRTVFAALDHFGVAYEVLECGDYMALPPGHAAPRGAYVLAHDGAGAGIKPQVAVEIAKSVRGGAGLLTFDREINGWPAALRSLLPASRQSEQTDRIRFPATRHFITFGHEQDEDVGLDMPIGVCTFQTDGTFRSVASTGLGGCVVVLGQVDGGRVVAFGTGDQLYSEDVYGHVRGADGLMWRALVWVAAKPFPMRCIPPFVSARMDDCNGAYCAFGYVDVLNRYGIGPNLGLFIAEMGPTDWAAAKRLFDKGGADFSMHAFRDDLYKAKWHKPYAVLKDKPDLSNGGRDVRFEGLSIDHGTGRDLDDATVERNFKRMDDAFARAGIKHSRVINSHFGEIGWRAVPGFLARGADMPCNNAAVGQLYGNQPSWRPKPYGLRGRNGRSGLVIDRCPHHPGITHINMSPAHLGKTHMIADILSGHTPFAGESDRSRPQDAARRGITNVRLGLDSLAFGVIMTHEERIDAISPGDWETVVSAIIRGLNGWDAEFAGREHVSIICKRLFDSSLVYAETTETGLRCELCGHTDGPSPLTIWRNEGDGCTRRTVEIPRLDGFRAVHVT